MPIVTCPPIRAVRAGAEPENGTMVNLAPVSCCSLMSMKWSSPPRLDMPTVIAPGSALAASTSASIVSRPLPCEVTITLGSFTTLAR